MQLVPTSTIAKPPTPFRTVPAARSVVDPFIFDAISRPEAHVAGYLTSDSALHRVTLAQDLTRDIVLVEPDVIAWGGCSNIYRGIWARWWLKDDVDRTMMVALKVPRTSKGRRDPIYMQERLNHEVRILVRLSHPNVVALLGTAFVFGGEGAMVLPWYKNGTVVKYAQTRSASCRLCLIKEICAGMKYLHTLEPPIVHGDLKGENILVNDGGHAVISDFGLSNETLGTTQITIGGSLRWLAPELLFDVDNENENEGCCEGLALSKASDVWAFGCTTYELLIGHLPYHNRQFDWAIIQDIMGGIGPLRPEDMLIHESIELSSLLEVCWSLQPCNRPTMVEIAPRLGDVIL